MATPTTLKRHPSVSASTARQLRKVAKQIVVKPEGFNMGTWANGDRRAEGSACGTTCCIGGQALVNVGVPWQSIMEDNVVLPGMDMSVSTPEAAATLLGLDNVQARTLFYSSGWPERFKRSYVGAVSYARQAMHAARRIEHFITTGE